MKMYANAIFNLYFLDNDPLTLTVINENTNDDIANPISYIVCFAILFYAFGVNLAKRESVIAKRSIPLILKKILFLGISSEYKLTINAIIHQLYVIISTFIALGVASDPYTNQSEVALIFSSVIAPLLVYQAFFLIKVEITKKKKNLE